MKIVEALEAAQSENPHGVDARGLHSTEHVQVTMITLKPGEGLKRHVTSVDVFFYVLEGVGKVEIGGETQEVGADMLVESPARISHRLFNESDADFRFLVVKTLRQTDATRLL